jgi:3-oxoacyl-[acyl-carrier protein] reductase
MWMPRDRMHVTKRNIVVTGSSGRIGSAIVQSLVSLGDLVVGFDLRPSILEGLDGFLSQAVDIAEETAVKDAVSGVLGKYGPIHALVNCAGVSPKREDGGKTVSWEVAMEEWRSVFNVNLFGAVVCCNAVIPSMIGLRSGSIVNIGSAMAEVGASNAKGTLFPASNSGAHYCASKAALHNFTWSSARELGEFGVRVNAIAPGPVSDGMLRLPSSIEDALLAQIPLGTFSMAQDIAEAVQFLLDDVRSKQITGHVLNVNGGWIMG